ncbi:5-methyltetrahydropteroyltriglutamate--homocysteine S-methyltransferase [Methylococcus mesophilus]|uniref:5-methyltetrahydropteroyltriglutamate-- homocysteine S-methyltransferase n=1 Tax=Methylococcus mesophilus TaxID=2993564 RepID=UPI00224B1DF9|nr:5-methyltetrahydropteroyltriglutamate--homocysteine S-methyltransferase [Methylococcus mesophilus]UZR28464.1 5-methyltetrahydropteroyltriglutamate--homocysteine S-methyltransferase [Methylococcus mesophilus]
MAVTHSLGFPRIGAGRELKQAVEAHWAGRTGPAELAQTGRELRERHWMIQSGSGIDLVPVGDFAWYDQMLNMTALLGAAPRRFGFQADALSLDQYFQLARGNVEQPAMEMTKWFDTNYHYIVPEFDRETGFGPGVDWLFDEVEEAKALRLNPKPVLIGPLTFLYLGKERQAGFSRLELLPRLLPAYAAILQRLHASGVHWVQMDEPILGLDLPPEWIEAFAPAYAALAEAGPKLLLATYFASVAEHAAWLKYSAVAGVHVDAVRAPEQVADFVEDFPADKVLSLGLTDGRNIWRTDLRRALDLAESASAALGERLWLAPSCSLLHVPQDLDLETSLNPEIKAWLAFAVQKLEELAVIDKGLRLGRQAVATELAEQERLLHARAQSPLTHDPAVKRRLEGLSDADFRRYSPFAERCPLQRERLRLPPFPTTTIGSFPQTPAIRKARAAHRSGELNEGAYRDAMRAAIREAVSRQEALGLDLLVHGEAERNDMVEYFGEQLAGYAFTKHGWVQSYGSRCVKPPIIYGDVARPRPMTVEWIGYAQGLTKKPVKGMLTGPVTMLQWSFVRDDQPRAVTALQIALAIRDEVADLEAAGVAAIQIDEPAFREGLPLKAADRADYLDWAVKAFRLASCGVADDTQIHTHMCYSEFGDILPAIAALDADVITIETCRSAMDLLEAFRVFGYPNDIGPGVYDIHSPRVPAGAEMRALLEKAAAAVDPERLWVNPDCGLKTRQWPEAEQALANMVEAARAMRGAISPARSAA